ncbi:MAG: serine hydrolase domain-containing protein [Bacteroidia bacterium]
MASAIILLLVIQSFFSLCPPLAENYPSFPVQQDANHSEIDDSLKIAVFVEKYVSEKLFSGTILVAKAGKSVFYQSYGLADIHKKIVIKNEYHYSIASITKLFTSIRVLQLVEENKLELTMTLKDCLSDLAIPGSSDITVHHLLLHISGLPNEKNESYKKTMDPEEMVSIAMANESGARFGSFHYNNIDYILLGLIIERVTGNSWKEEIQTHILDKLEMNDSGFLEHNRYPENFAGTFSYKKSDKPKKDPRFYIENFYAAGAMYSTASDLLKLDQALYENILLNEEMYKLLSQSYSEYNYVGYGVWNYHYPFVPSQPLVMERRGGIMGANTVLVRLPDTQHAIIILSNNDQFNPDSFGDGENLREALMRIVAR